MREPTFDSHGARPPLPQLPPPGASYPDALMPQTNPWAIVSLASSILAWCGLFGIGGLIGIITGIVARNEILTSYGTQSGESLAFIGIILGAANVLFACLLMLCISSLFVTFAGL